jgi:uncharacterized phage protein gp47/JayE
MPLARPKLSELILRCEQDLASRLGLGQLIPRGPAAALARVIAGTAHGQYGKIEAEVANVWPDTCDAENLDRWGALLSLPRKPAVAAEGLVVMVGTNGTTIAQGSLVQRADGRQFATLNPATVVGGTANIPVLAVETGYGGNTAALTPLVLASSVVGTINSVQVDAIGLEGGVDEEGDEAFRARLVQRLSMPPAAGTAGDYERWALEVPGVTRAWALPANQGPGTVGVTFVVDGDPVSIIPTPSKVAEVQAYIDARKPITASVLVFAPVLITVDFTIHVVPDTAEVRQAVSDSLEVLLEREGAPASTIPLSHVREAISLAPGETDHVLTAPVADLVIGAGHIPAVGTITWT